MGLNPPILLSGCRTLWKAGATGRALTEPYHKACGIATLRAQPLQKFCRILIRFYPPCSLPPAPCPLLPYLFFNVPYEAFTVPMRSRPCG
jgi:hypothetical protein